MVLNPDKCSLMLLGVDDELQTNLVCGNETLKNNKQEKVLGVTTDNKLNFATHLSNITENANIKFKVVVWCNSRKMSFFIKSNISKKVTKIHG